MILSKPSYRGSYSAWGELMDRVQGEHAADSPLSLGEAWRLRKGKNVVICSVGSHALGWKLDLRGGPLIFSRVCRSLNEALSTQQQWKMAMVERGWDTDG